MTRFRFRDRLRPAQRDQMQRLVERGLPAAILVLVALLQLHLAQTAHLSPWKGGGFGMFGAIDAPDMRVIQGEGLDQDGHLLQLDVYSALDVRTIRRTRTLPRQSDLEQMAPQFVDQVVVPTTIQRQALYQKLQIENPDDLAAQDGMPIDAFNPFPHLPSHPIAQPLYRLKTVYDPQVPRAEKTLKAIRLQWWQIHFDQAHHRLRAVPLSPVVKAGVWS